MQFMNPPPPSLQFPLRLNECTGIPREILPGKHNYIYYLVLLLFLSFSVLTALQPDGVSATTEQPDIASIY